MEDIVKCPGTDCPVKETCKRFTNPVEDTQSYFLDAPFKIEDNNFTCDMYWGEQAEALWNHLKEIVGIKIPK